MVSKKKKKNWLSCVLTLILVLLCPMSSFVVRTSQCFTFMVRLGFSHMVLFFEIFRMSIEITKTQIFGVWISKTKIKRVEAVFSFIMSYFDGIQFSEDAIKALKATVSQISFKINERWAKCGRKRDVFERINSSWLNETITLPHKFLDEIPSTSNIKKVGRPKKNFEECCEKIKMKKVQSLLDSYSFEEIGTAYEKNLWKVGKRDTAAIIKKLALSSPKEGLFSILYHKHLFTFDLIKVQI